MSGLKLALALEALDVSVGLFVVITEHVIHSTFNQKGCSLFVEKELMMFHEKNENKFHYVNSVAIASCNTITPRTSETNT